MVLNDLNVASWFFESNQLRRTLDDSLFVPTCYAAVLKLEDGGKARVFSVYQLDSVEELKGDYWAESLETTNIVFCGVVSFATQQGKALIHALNPDDLVSLLERSEEVLGQPGSLKLLVNKKMGNETFLEGEESYFSKLSKIYGKDVKICDVSYLTKIVI